MSEFHAMRNQVVSLDQRFARLETLVGNSKDEGLRGEMTKIEGKIERLEEQIEKVMDRIATAEKRHMLMIGGGFVALWFLERFFLK